ncbi:MAG: methyltransferase domain-containing protein [Planctomycetota bacterium]|jgi:tRNA/tmRNA/rRNA uracil-C5-methylase (TrmA/RlmC/RlmD family)
MTRHSVILRLILVLLCLLTLAGCDRSAKERDEALAEVQKLRAELVKKRTALEEIQDENDKLRTNLTITSHNLEDAQTERDELKESLAIISEELEDSKSELATAMQACDKLYEQAYELATECDASIAWANEVQATIGELSNQLREKTSQLPGLEQWSMELQTTIEDLEGQIEEINWRSIEQLTEEIWGIRGPDVEFVPTPQDVVDKMLEMAKVTKDDFVYDLGCGDGRIVVTAARRFGCRAIGYDIDSERVKESLENVEINDVGHLVRIEQKDIFTLDLSRANVITLYLLPSLNVELIPQLEKLKPGSRIVSHNFDMEGVQPDKVVKINSNEDDKEHKIYLWTSPLKKI